MRKRTIFLVSLVLLLAACDQRPEDREYYKGVEGVDAGFASGSPPSELFVRGEGPVSFPVDIRIINEGASLAKGGVYLSGYDPTIIDFEEIEEGRDFFDTCRFSIRDIRFASFEGVVQCRRVDLGEFGETNLGISIDDGVIIDIQDLSLGALIDSLFGTDLFQSLGFDTAHVRFDTHGGGRLDVKFDNPNFDPANGARGPYFLSLWAPISFEQNGGRQFLLGGDVPTSPGEKEEFITFHGEVTGLPEGSDRTTQPIMLTSCYLYTTYATPTVCVDPEPYSDNDKTCRPSSYVSSGQGAPVAITSVTQKTSGSEMVFRIEIQNLGRGKVYNPLNIQRCSPYNPVPLTEEDTDVVVLGMAYLGDRVLECYPEEHTVRLYDGRGVINCVYDMDEGAYTKSGYETNLVLELWYGYSETTRRDIEIHRI